MRHLFFDLILCILNIGEGVLITPPRVYANQVRSASTA